MAVTRPRRARSPWRGPAALALVGGVLLVVLAFWALPLLLTRQPPVSGADRHSAMGEVRNSLMTFVVGIGAAISVAYTARSYRLSQVSHLTGRFQDAAKLIGESDPLMRLGGIEAMAQLADEWPGERQRCIDMLCAHVRHVVDVQADPREIDHHGDTRRRVFEIIRDALAADADSPWHGCRFDFRYSVFRGIDLRGLVLTSGSFDFSHSRFYGSGSDHPDLDLRGSTFGEATIRFDHATFDSAYQLVLSDTTSPAVVERGSLSFAGARFDACDAVFDSARIGADAIVSFEGADVAADSLISFRDAIVRGHVVLDGANIDGDVTFEGAGLSGATLSLVAESAPRTPLDLRGAQCAGSTLRCTGTDDRSRERYFDLADATGDPIWTSA